MKKRMKKGKITMIITIGISCFALVLVMFMQFKIVNETDITSIENMREAELRTELANWKSKYEETNQKYEETTQKIEEYKQTSQSNEETEKLVDEELSQVNLSLGKTDVQGQGIEVTLRENESEEIARINGDDLLVIVNSLKMAGAEAISINDQRIVYDSYIADINEANRISCGCRSERIYVNTPILSYHSWAGHSMDCIHHIEWEFELQCPICRRKHYIQDGNC